MKSVDVAAVMQGLKGFQQDAVEHVIDRFYGSGRSGGSGRFLVADETGLGKSVVARGIIARAIEELEADDSVGRIDIVYVCSNADLANQNLQRLNVTGDEHLTMATRLTLLARESRKLSAHDSDDAKKVNLVSFTPGTSFKEGGWRSGNADERALLCVLAEDALQVEADEATRWLFQGAVRSAQNFSARVRATRKRLGVDGADPEIAERFQESITTNGLWHRFLELREQVRRFGGRPHQGKLWHDITQLIGTLRRHLARAGVAALEPDLIILDEFQRFRSLLDPETEGGELADDLFRSGNAKVLLLSATPFKAYTADAEVGVDHHRDFLNVIQFLADDNTSQAAAVKTALEDHRLAMVTGGDAATTALRAREALLPLMSRSERPPLARNQDMVVDRPLDGGVPTPDEIADWAALHRLGNHLGARVDLEQWKSIPYFASFMDTYKSGSSVREALENDDGAVSELLAETSGLTREALKSGEELALGNGLLRALAADTIGQGWWKLLWMPPSMPYLAPGPVYSSVGDVTKHVVFSAWNGVPTAVAGLLSHEATRRAYAGSGRAADSTSSRLAWAMNEAGRPTQMSTLALFWPHPTLAQTWDPLRAAREAGEVIDAKSFTFRASSGDETQEPSHAFFASPGAVPPGTDPLSILDFLDGSDRFGDYVRTAAVAMEREPRTHRDLARLAAHSPGSIAYRALKSAASTDATAIGIWRAAWVLSLGLRSLFARPDTAALLDTVGDPGAHYWNVVLDYCADGNLQAVMDEYVHQLRSELGGRPLDDALLLKIAEQVASAVRTNAATLRGHEATAKRAQVPFPTRFAARYGGTGTDADAKVAARQSEVRAAFNSPFAPFVLTSTSIGQEGIDFHWWSHAVVHWNLPSNPVDFEQREGRVHRFMGHAVRKNVAARHWDDVLASKVPSVWDAAFDAARTSPESAKLGQFAPWWVYEGASRIHRRIASFTLSRDHERYERLLDALTLYRLTLGQPRQEDMIRLLAKDGVERDLEEEAIDLRPPTRS